MALLPTKPGVLWEYVLFVEGNRKAWKFNSRKSVKT